MRAELLQQCETHKITIAELMWANERVWRSDSEIEAELDAIWNAMKKCLERGTRTSGVLTWRTKSFTSRAYHDARIALAS